MGGNSGALTTGVADGLAGGGVAIGGVDAIVDSMWLLFADGTPSVTTDCWAKHNGADDITSMLVSRAQHRSVRCVGLFFAVIGREYPGVTR